MPMVRLVEMLELLSECHDLFCLTAQTNSGKTLAEPVAPDNGDIGVMMCRRMVVFLQREVNRR